MDSVKKCVLIITLAIVTLIFIANIILMYSICSTNYPQKPSLTDSKTVAEQECKAKEISNYKELAGSINSQKSNLFELIVIKSLLPLFTSLIAGVFTYIIAKSGMTALSNFILEREKIKTKLNS